MKKSILSIGKALNKVEQKQVLGGSRWPFDRILCDYPGAGCPNHDNTICSPAFCN